MRSGGGKQKGAQFERDVCRELSLWISNGKQEDVFWRSAMSGGRSTVAAAKGKRLAAQSGDISCISSVGSAYGNKFFIECKFYADFNLFGLLTGKGKLVEFWAEAKKQAKFYHRSPMLVFKQNRMPTMVGLGAAGVTELGLNGHANLIATQCNLFIIPLSTFLKYAVRPT